MDEQDGLGFAGLLRLLRARARLTQEELADAASLSPRSVSDLERGIHRTAQKETARLLADALGLGDPVLGLFIAAARGRASAAEVLAAVPELAPGAAAAVASRTLPRDTAGFTGREGELARLLDALTSTGAVPIPGIHAIDGMAGIGKTTLAVHAAHQLAGKFPDGQFFLPLHAHTPGQRPIDPGDALASLLLTAGVPAQRIPPGLEARAARWRDHTAGKKILLLLDDASGYEQVRPLLPGSAGSMVLITSRRRLAALDDAAQISLDTLSPGEAAALFARLVARPSLSPADAAIADITRQCGYLPLAIGMLASQLRNHPSRTAAGLAAEIAVAKDRLSFMYAENLSVSAAFDLSYADLEQSQQRLFRRTGVAPGPSLDAYAAAALDGGDPATARRILDELYDQHLINEPAPGRYELHDLLREHARALAAADDPAEAEEAAGRLLDYYVHGALAAGRHFMPWGRDYHRPPPGRPPAHVSDLSAFAQAAAWLEAERANLHAAADYATAHGRLSHVVAIAAAMSGFLSARGYWDESAALHRCALAAARQAGDRLGEAGVLVELGGLQQATGDYPAGTASLVRAAAMFEDIGDGSGEAYALSRLGFGYLLTGDYQAAAASHEKAVVLARTASDRLAETVALCDLGLLQQLTGDHRAASVSMQQALAQFSDLGNLHGQALALNGLGVVQQEIGEYAAASASQERALVMFRDLGDLLGQAYVFNDVGLVHQETGDYPAAAISHRRALAIFGDLGNRVGEAEALNRLGELATRTSDPGQARELHTEALVIARDIGAVPEEARALEGLGLSYVQAGSLGEAAAHLRHALAIYQRMGAPGAQRVTHALQELSGLHDG